jgi:hypothetical protein
MYAMSNVKLAVVLTMNEKRGGVGVSIATKMWQLRKLSSKIKTNLADSKAFF